MIKIELHVLEEIANLVVSSHQTGNSYNILLQQDELQKRIIAESRRLRQLWTGQIFSMRTENQAMRFVQYLQSGVTLLSDKVSALLPGADFYAAKVSEWSRLLQGILLEWEQLLRFLQDYHYRYFNSDYTITRFLFEGQREHINFLLSDLQKDFKRLKLPEDLYCVITLSVNIKVSNAEIYRLSYREMEFLHLLLAQVTLLTKNQSVTTDDIAVELIRMKFNAISFIGWYKSFLVNEVKKVSGKKSKSEKLKNVLNRLLQINPVARPAFDEHLPAAGQEIIEWLNQELLIYDNQHNKSTLKTIGFKKFPLTLSVAQLALLTRMLFLEGVYASQNVSEIIRFVATHFSTKKQSNISVKSFARAFYSSDQLTAAVVRSLMQKIISQIDQYYFSS